MSEVPQMIAMCSAPNGEHDYWRIVDPYETDARSCLHGECDCTPAIFVRERSPEEVYEKSEEFLKRPRVTFPAERLRKGSA
jgi:hypothetical protein